MTAADNRRAYLHVGMMKAGTTFLQHVLTKSAGELRAGGVLFPIDGGYRKQVAGARDLVGLTGPETTGALAGAWDELRRQVRDFDGPTVVISVEQLSLASSEQVAAMISGLDARQVHAIVTVRDLARVLPSVWQENIQNGLSWTWREFIDSVTGKPGARENAGRRFWQQHDLMRIIKVWALHVPPSHIHVITVPPPDATANVLWERFCAVAGLDPVVASVDTTRAQRNLSLSTGATEFLRRLNVTLDGVLTKREYAINVKRAVAKRALRGLTRNNPVALDPALLAWCHDRSIALVGDLQTAGVDVVGDLAELMPAHSGGSPFDPSTVDPADIAHAAAIAAAAAVRELTSRQGRMGQSSTPLLGDPQ